MRCRHAFVEVILQTIEPMVAPDILWCVPHRHRHRMDTGTDMDTDTILKKIFVGQQKHMSSWLSNVPYIQIIYISCPLAHLYDMCIYMICASSMHVSEHLYVTCRVVCFVFPTPP